MVGFETAPKRTQARLGVRESPERVKELLSPFQGSNFFPLNRGFAALTPGYALWPLPGPNNYQMDLTLEYFRILSSLVTTGIPFMMAVAMIIRSAGSA